MKPQVTTISDFPLPDSLSLEMQVIADIVTFPHMLIEAERLVSEDIFVNEECKNAWNVIRNMAKRGQVIDLPSIHNKVDKNLLINGIIPLQSHATSELTTLQHVMALKDIYVKRKCYFAAIQLLSSSTAAKSTSQDLLEQVRDISETVRKEADTDHGTQHISQVINNLGVEIEEKQRMKAEGKVLRVPTGIQQLDYITYGGFNAGNLVILAARPSVGKTAIMLQMAKAAAYTGKNVNLFNLEMTNTELAQRLLFSTGHLAPLQVARGEVEWSSFELAASRFSSKPMYLNDTSRTLEEIRARIVMNVQAGKCDVAFIDYLGLIKKNSNNKTMAQAIGEITNELKNLALSCKIPIVLLCQLNRVSASEKRPPEMHDLRDSGDIEQDADIILMLERPQEDESGRAVNVWVRKNRQGAAGNVKIELVANETYTKFYERADDDMLLPSYLQDTPTIVESEFENNPDFPF